MSIRMGVTMITSVIQKDNQIIKNDFEFDLQLTVSSYCMKVQKLLINTIPV